MLASLAEAMAYLTAAHTSLVEAQQGSEGRLDECFDAAYELVAELNNEITLIYGRSVQREH